MAVRATRAVFLSCDSLIIQQYIVRTLVDALERSRATGGGLRAFGYLFECSVSGGVSLVDPLSNLMSVFRIASIVVRGAPRNAGVTPHL